MKKIFTIMSLSVLFFVLVTGCSKRTYYDNGGGWMSKESGIVVYADTYCPYYVIETYRGYTIIRATGGFTPWEGDEIFGDLSRYGFREFYNYTDDSFIRGEVTDYWLSYGEAQYIIDNLCYTYNRVEGKGVDKKVIRKDVPKNQRR